MAIQVRCKNCAKLFEYSRKFIYCSHLCKTQFFIKQNKLRAEREKDGRITTKDKKIKQRIINRKTKNGYIKTCQQCRLLFEGHSRNNNTKSWCEKCARERKKDRRKISQNSYDNSIRLKSFRIRGEILTFWKNKCLRCKDTKGPFEIHHIDYSDWRPYNCRILCVSCHKRIHRDLLRELKAENLELLKEIKLNTPVV